MVIDDHPGVREHYRNLLEANGFCVVEACNGAEALIWFLKETADLIILDLRMPVLDGRSFLEYRSRLAKIREVPVLVVSSWMEDSGLCQSLLRLGADRLLQKPLRREDLLGAVQEALERPHPLAPPPRETAPEAARRQGARVAFTVPIRIRATSGADMSGRLHDLSAGGLGAHLPDRLLHGEPITVTLDAKGGSLALPGFIQWADEKRTDLGYRHGIRFSERQEETFPLYAYSFFHESSPAPSQGATA